MRRSLCRLIVILLAFECLTVATAPAMAAASAPTPWNAATQCTALGMLDLGSLAEAPTQVMSTEIVAQTATEPAHCLVKTYIAPNIQTDIRLPVAGWTGKFANVGCGGMCGKTYPVIACSGLLSRGFACVVSNMGHTSTSLDGKWGLNNLQAEYDFAIRATHASTVAGKAITAAYYGRPLNKSYFLGCSTGGRQAMMAAQRFPYDFDGIVAGAPVINETGDALTLAWNTLAMRRPDGKPMLTRPQVEGLHAAAVKACDMDDGVADGIISHPRQCGFRPETLACKPGSDNATCLTTQQVDAVRRIYAGPHTSDGKQILDSSALPGSELNWIGNYLPDGAQEPAYYQFLTDFFRYLAFVPDRPAPWKLEDLDWDEDYKRLDLMEAMYSATNPDLRRFKAHGGKLLHFHGLADQSVLVQPSIDYYETATRVMGGATGTRDFYRLFLIPGMNHCTGGEGAYRIDYLKYLDDWVENGQAPDELLATHPANPYAFKSTQWGLDQMSGADIIFSRPIYAYPESAAYKGAGDVNDAKNWKRVTPRSK